MATDDRSETLGPVLARLWEIIEERAAGGSSRSYTVRLLEEGVPRIAQKVGEEACETVIATVTGDREAAIAESGDLLYHLLVLWRAAGLHPDDVAVELARRRPSSRE